MYKNQNINQSIKYTKLGSLIRGESLKRLIEQAHRIEKANIHLREVLPEPLSDHVSVCNIKGNVLILRTNSPVWFTRTNFLATQIIDYMRKEGGLAMVDRLKVKVIPSDYNSDHTTDKDSKQPAPRRVRQLSSATSALLTSAADYEQDEGLARVLRNLAEHQKARQ
jgi:hypothetical protein